MWAIITTAATLMAAGIYGLAKAIENAASEQLHYRNWGACISGYTRGRTATAAAWYANIIYRAGRIWRA